MGFEPGPVGRRHSAPEGGAELVERAVKVRLDLLGQLQPVDDIVRGFDSAGLINMIGIVVAAVLVYGSTVLRDGWRAA